MESVEVLVAEFAGQVTAGAVISETVRSREQLLACGVRSGLVEATEAMTRTRLRDHVAGGSPR